MKRNYRNGVLFYLALKSRKFAILGDSGIHSSASQRFLAWHQTRNATPLLPEGDFVTGLNKGIRMAGEALQKKFPYQKHDATELSDDIVLERIEDWIMIIALNTKRCKLNTSQNNFQFPISNFQFPRQIVIAFPFLFFVLDPSIDNSCGWFSRSVKYAGNGYTGTLSQQEQISLGTEVGCF